jgi:hypothetical protein
MLCSDSSLCAVLQILLFNLPVNFAQGTSIFWAYVIGFHEAPLTAIQVLYVNMVTVSERSALPARQAVPAVTPRNTRTSVRVLLDAALILTHWGMKKEDWYFSIGS